jgi:isopropylmalate/homocitrate/citramalate synthase
MSDRVQIVEMGPRDGLQNEKVSVSVEARIAFVEALVAAGLTTCEVGAFVSPKAIPQMVGSDQVLRAVGGDVPMAKLAMHFHDTYGQALANLYAGMEEGVFVIDAAAGGLGGCPYAPGATGNVATEDVVYMLEGMGIPTGVDMDKLLAATNQMSTLLGRPPVSRVASALNAKRSKAAKA